MHFPLRLRGVFGLLLLVVGACRTTGFRPTTFSSNDALYKASFDKLRKHKWDDAVAGFEHLIDVLPARDPLLPQALYYVAQAHDQKGENILAAQNWSRLAEDFPDDTLADLSLFNAGRAYGRMWHKPSLDADYGETARSTYRTLISVYPQSPLRKDAEQEIERLNEWFATKSYENGMLYLRRKAYDSAIIYFKDVARLYPQTAHARMAQLKMVAAYKKIRYSEEVAETCASLHRNYPGDREVRDECGPAPDTAVAPQPAPVPTP